MEVTIKRTDPDIRIALATAHAEIAAKDAEIARLREMFAKIDQQVAHGKLGDWHMALTEIRVLARQALAQGSQT